ncbi:hypothetical protein RF11_07005 [Thelohanellus kitauei]|uniref:Uncharacterized protein n=1 Tax=Thelohanellus kitauei TaxID=669202 RepID=A0A0C2J8P6_THEKT|nr:hypothetical protein RF11_07005 [Thelohanellus kitauei]
MVMYIRATTNIFTKIQEENSSFNLYYIHGNQRQLIELLRHKNPHHGFISINFDMIKIEADKTTHVDFRFSYVFGPQGKIIQNIKINRSDSCYNEGNKNEITESPLDKLPLCKNF